MSIKKKVAITMCPIFLAIYKLMGVRVLPEIEILGMDVRHTSRLNIGIADGMFAAWVRMCRDSE